MGSLRSSSLMNGLMSYNRGSRSLASSTTMWRHSKKALAMNQGKSPPQNAIMLTLWSWISRLPEVWEINLCFLFYLFIYFCFLGMPLRHMEVPRLGIESELQLLATDTAIPDPSHLCNLHHSLRPCWILDPFIEQGHGSNPNPHGY